MSYVKHNRRFLALAGSVLMIVTGTAAAQDLADIVVAPAAGQNVQQTRRDRYECHNWVISQNGTVPAGGAARQAASDEQRASRISKVITGAALGAAVGGMIRGARDYREADDGALAGGLLGAIGGAVVGGRQARKEEDTEFSNYFRALSACMVARGYSVSITE